MKVALKLFSRDESIPEVKAIMLNIDQDILILLGERVRICRNLHAEDAGTVSIVYEYPFGIIHDQDVDEELLKSLNGLLQSDDEFILLPDDFNRDEGSLQDADPEYDRPDNLDLRRVEIDRYGFLNFTCVGVWSGTLYETAVNLEYLESTYLKSKK